jgi:hypothetical protein
MATILQHASASRWNRVAVAGLAVDRPLAVANGARPVDSLAAICM